MTTPFTGSRLANLREKRTPQIEKISPTKQVQQPLTLPEQQDNSYQPSIAFNGGRTATRFLKGRIQKTNHNEKQTSTILGNQFRLPNKQNHIGHRPSLHSQKNDGELKLILNDSPVFEKKTETKATVQPPQQKRILIQKRESQQIKQEVKQQIKPAKQTVNPVQQQIIEVKKQTLPEGPITQQDVEQSNVMENQNELVQCPQGCGRKFNRKALEKHAKACKLVFMSKRKQFNSEAKRLTSQQQATIMKKNKLQEKKAQLGKTKGKGFDKIGEKTSQNWKNASEDFRSAVKALKNQGTGEQGNGEEQMKITNCEFCEKPFAEVLLPKHLENCLKKKEKQQKEKKKAQRKK